MESQMNSLKNYQARNMWFIEGFYAQNYSSFDMVLHSHDRIELMYCSNGEFSVEFMNNNANEYLVIKAGEFILIDSGVPHKFYLQKEQKAKILGLEFVLKPSTSGLDMSIQKLADAQQVFYEFIKSKQRVYKILDDGTIQKTMITLQHEMNFLQDKSTKIIIDSLLTQLFIGISRCFYNESRFLSGYSYVRKAVEHIENNYCNDISVNELANVININESDLRKFFQKTVGMSITKYINTLRVKRACLLLENSNSKINDVISASGFNNRQNFAKIFKEHMNSMTPNEYRSHIYKNTLFRHENIEQNMECS